MSHPILTTKLYMPRTRPHLVPRPRLTRLLTAGLDGALTLVSAPAGFGKTTLVAEWWASPEGREWPLAWLALDPEDGDPVRFWTYVVAALRTLPAFARDDRLGAATLDLLRAGAHPLPHEALVPLLNELSACPSTFVLVLDDLHTVDSPAIHAALGYLVDHLPPAMRLVVLTRADPPWPLARLRASGQLAELRAADLRFTAEEAAAFLNTAMGLGLAAGDLAALQRRTEGWIAALQMVALSLAAHTDRHAFVTALAGDHRHIADYLLEEVVSRQPEPVQQFLLQTAVLERLTPPLCNAVTQRGDARAMLEHVERANLFLVPLDEDRRWYRYHHLFADLLQARLGQVMPGAAAQLHRRAADWYEENGHHADAVHHALGAGDFDRVARLIEANIHGWWALAAGTYISLFSRLPAAVVRSRPSFCLYQAWVSIVSGQPEAALSLIADAERLLGESGAGEHAQATSMRRFLSLMRKYAAELTGEPYHLTDQDVGAPALIPEPLLAMRNSAEVILGFMLQMTGDFDSAADSLWAPVRRDVAAGGTNAIPIAMSRLVRMRLIQGRLREADAMCSEHLKFIGERGEQRFYVNGSLHSARADILREQGQLDQAAQQARDGVRHNEAWGVPHAIALAQVALGRVLLSRGETGEAQEVLERAELAIRGRRIPTDLASELTALQVRLWLARGDMGPAIRWARDSGPDPGAPPGYRHELALITLARVWLAAGRAGEAGRLLARLAGAAETGGRLGRLMEILALQALSLSPSDPDGALRALRRALALAEPEGFVRTFVDEGQPMQELLRRLLQAGGSAPGYAARLLGVSGDAGDDGPLALAESLSQRELEVLRLLAAGHSNQEIAAAITVTVGTVKTHVHHICSKLDARSRTQAVARARELRLL